MRWFTRKIGFELPVFFGQKKRPIATSWNKGGLKLMVMKLVETETIFRFKSLLGIGLFKIRQAVELRQVSNFGIFFENGCSQQFLAVLAFEHLEFSSIETHDSAHAKVAAVLTFIENAKQIIITVLSISLPVKYEYLLSVKNLAPHAHCRSLF